MRTVSASSDGLLNFETVCSPISTVGPCTSGSHELAGVVDVVGRFIEVIEEERAVLS